MTTPQNPQKINDALAHLTGDAAIAETLERAARMPEIEFQKARENLAHSLGVGAGALDKLRRDAQRALITTFDQDEKGGALALLLEISRDLPLIRAAGEDDGEAGVYALVQEGDHVECRRVGSKWFLSYLRRELWARHGKGASTEILKAATGALFGKGMTAPQHEIFLRTARRDAAIYLDMGDARWRVIQVTPYSWSVVNGAPVCFRRTRSALSLPEPCHYGEIARLRRYANVKSEQDFVLIVAWLLAALSGRGPYPILVLLGDAGSAKSSLARFLRALVDPNAAPLRSLHGAERDAFVSAVNNHTLVFDNVDYLTSAQADTLCKLATGGGLDNRALYSDGEENILSATRPIILTSINNVVIRGDLASRAFVIELNETVPNRLPESELEAVFEQDGPFILGALLDALVIGLKRESRISTEGLGRMADAARWGVACETAFWPQGAVAKALKENASMVLSGVASADPVAAAIDALMASKVATAVDRATGDQVWTGTATKLLQDLAVFTTDGARRSRSWPQGPNALSGRLRYLRAAVELLGVTIEHNREGHERIRTITLRCKGSLSLVR